MKKVIELLEEIKMNMELLQADSGFQKDVVSEIKKQADEAIAILKAPPRWETPKQWKQRTGEAWPDDAAVRTLNPDGEWELMEYWRAKQLEQDLARLDKDFGEEPGRQFIVCDRGEYGPPSDGWRPEEEKA